MTSSCHITTQKYFLKGFLVSVDFARALSEHLSKRFSHKLQADNVHPHLKNSMFLGDNNAQQIQELCTHSLSTNQGKD